MDYKSIIHYSFHFLVPGIIAFLFYRKQWQKVYLLLIAGIIIDLDHLLASPIFDPNRCSINFHPLHSYYAITLYFAFFFYKKTRIIGLALLLHILADSIDCYL